MKDFPKTYDFYLPKKLRVLPTKLYNTLNFFGIFPNKNLPTLTPTSMPTMHPYPNLHPQPHQ